MNGKWNVIISKKEMDYIKNCADGKLISARSPINLHKKIKVLKKMNEDMNFEHVYHWDRIARAHN